MANLMHSARLLVTDLASTLLFLIVLLITKDLMLAVGLGVGLGIIQIAWMKIRRQRIDTMQWLSIGLVVVSGIATMLTSDARFVMVKPSVRASVSGSSLGVFWRRKLASLNSARINMSSVISPNGPISASVST